MTGMEQRISLITLGVADLHRAMAFYAGLGWQGASPDGDVAFYQAGGMVFALWSRDKLAEDSAVADGGGWGGTTLAYTARSPEEVDAVLAEAEAAGATIGRPGAATFWGGYSGRLPRPRRPSLGGRAQPVLDDPRGRHGQPGRLTAAGVSRNAAGVRPASATTSRVRCGWSA